MFCVGLRANTVSIFIVQYNAWCINNGSHWTKNIPFTDWNRELIWKMRTELEHQWDLLEETIPTTFKELLDSVKRHFHGLESLLESMSVLSALADIITRALIRTSLAQGFPSMVVNNIEYWILNFEYRFLLIQIDFAREVQYVIPTSYRFLPFLPLIRRREGGGFVSPFMQDFLFVHSWEHR